MIKTWQQRCEDHEGIVTEQMIRYRMQEEIDELRQALAQPEQEREWVGLTDDEKYDVLEGATGDGGRVYYDTLFRSYEAKLKEKNSG